MKLTKREKQWVKRVQKALDSCPSNRIGFYTIGDCDVSLFDVTRYGDICTEMDKRSGVDFGTISDNLGHGCAESLNFPNQVESAAG